MSWRPGVLPNYFNLNNSLILFLYPPPYPCRLTPGWLQSTLLRNGSLISELFLECLLSFEFQWLHCPFRMWQVLQSHGDDLGAIEHSVCWTRLHLMHVHFSIFPVSEPQTAHSVWWSIFVWSHAWWAFHRVRCAPSGIRDFAELSIVRWPYLGLPVWFATMSTWCSCPGTTIRHSLPRHLGSGCGGLML